MAALANPRHEKFAQALAEGMAAGRAYEAAGYTARGHVADTNASRLLTNAKVAARLAELQNKAAEQTGVTLEWLIEEGKSLMLAAKAAEEFTAASAQFERLCKVSGHWVDRSAVDQNSVTRVFSSEPLSEEEWEARHGQIAH